MSRNVRQVDEHRLSYSYTQTTTIRTVTQRNRSLSVSAYPSQGATISQYPRTSVGSGRYLERYLQATATNQTPPRSNYLPPSHSSRPLPITNSTASTPLRNFPSTSSLPNRHYDARPISYISQAGSSNTLNVPKQAKKLVVRKSEKFHDKNCPVPTYSTHSKKRGRALIISNILHTDKSKKKCAEKDHENLQELFKQMGFKVTSYLNLKKSAMIEKIREFSAKNSLKSYDICSVVVMSYGTANKTKQKNEIFAADDKGVLVDDLIVYFNDDLCKQMMDKPKIFLFHCSSDEEVKVIEKDSTSYPNKVAPLRDALVTYSSLPDFKNETEGSVYISAVCDIFTQHAHQYHVEDLLKMVERQLSLSHIGWKPQHSFYENRAFKRCFLHPK